MLSCHCAASRTPASARTAQVAQACLVATLAPVSMVSRAVNAVTIPTPSTVAATSASTSDWPDWPFCARRPTGLLDRTDQPVHGRDHGDRDESHHQPHRDHQRGFEEGDGLFQAVVHLLREVVGSALQVGGEMPGLLADLHHLDHHL